MWVGGVSNTHVLEGRVLARANLIYAENDEMKGKVEVSSVICVNGEGERHVSSTPMPLNTCTVYLLVDQIPVDTIPLPKAVI